MGREVRRVPKGWKHPKYMSPWGERFQPLFEYDRYQGRLDEWNEYQAKFGTEKAIEEFGMPPSKDDYMPNWDESECTHYMMYETTSEGTPISPAFETPEKLARWLTDNGASAFGDMTATYEQWLHTARGNWAPSAIISDGQMVSGVEGMTHLDLTDHPEVMKKE